LAGTSAWRVNDVVAYDVMRESATTLTALLLESVTDDAGVAELAELRRAVLNVDGYDRVQVGALASSINYRIAELSRAR